MIDFLLVGFQFAIGVLLALLVMRVLLSLMILLGVWVMQAGSRFIDRDMKRRCTPEEYEEYERNTRV